MVLVCFCNSSCCWLTLLLISYLLQPNNTLGSQQPPIHRGHLAPLDPQLDWMEIQHVFPKKKRYKTSGSTISSRFFWWIDWGIRYFTIVFPVDNSLLKNWAQVPVFPSLSGGCDSPWGFWGEWGPLEMGSAGNGVLTLPEKSLAILRFFGWEDCFVVPANQSRKKRRPHILLRNGSSSTMKNLVFCFKPKASIGPVYLSVLVDQKNPCHQM